MTHRPAAAARPRRAGRLIIAASLVLAAMVPAVAAGPTAGAADPDVATVTATPASGVLDGQRVVVNVASSSTDFPVISAEARLCRPGVTYQTSDGLRPADDFAADGANCPRNSVSSAGALYPVAVAVGIGPRSLTAQGASFALTVGAGSAQWGGAANDQYSLTCDSTTPCSLVVQLQRSPRPEGTPRWTPVVIPISFAVDDPNAGCTIVADTLAASAPDRINRLAGDWTRGACGADGALMKTTIIGEQGAVAGFDLGEDDLTFSAAGFSDEAKLLEDGLRESGQDPPAKHRAVVAVPIALNAAVLAVGNGVDSAAGARVPFTDIKLTLDEATAFLSGAQWGVAPHLDDIYARNPELKGSIFFAENAAAFLSGNAEPDSTTYFLTRHLDTLRHDAWKVPMDPVFEADRGQQRSIHNGFGAATPPFRFNTVTGRGPLQRLFTILPSGEGGIYVATDQATSKALGLTSISLGDQAGAFVAPTADAMRAAVGSMKAGPDGMKVPDPAASGADGTAAYPLTFVEYLMVPAEPLVDNATCVARDDSQQRLQALVSYAVGAGQQNLPPGMVALPDALKAEATAAVERVGQSPVTGECEGRVTHPTEPGDPDPPPVDVNQDGVPDVGAGDFGDLDLGDLPSSAFDEVGDDPSGVGGSSAGVGGASGSSAGSSGIVPPAAAPATGPDEAKPVAAVSGVPGFGGNRVVSGLLTVGALVTIVALCSVASVRSAGPRRRSGPPGDPG